MSVVQRFKNKILSNSSMSESALYDNIKNLLKVDGKTIYVGELLSQAAKKYPYTKALICCGKSVTYKELFFRSLLLSKKLKSLEVQPRDRVFLLFENSIEFYIAYFAILQVGAICVPLNTFLHEKELESIVNDSKPKAAIASSSLKGKLEGIKNKDSNVLQHILGEEDIDWEAPVPGSIELVHSDFKVETLSEDEVCLLLYTSGTTGEPKGVMLSSKNIISNTIQSISRLGMHMKLKDAFKPNTVFKERFFAALPLFHVFAQNVCIWFPITMGGTVIIVPKIDRREILEGLKHKPTLFSGVPALFGLLCLMKTAPLDSVKLFVSGGDAMTDKIRCAFSMVYGRKICAGYGLTEASPVVAVNIENREKSTSVVGVPLMGIECDVRRDSGESADSNEIGTLWIRGDNVMLGYYNSPEETAKVLKDGWLNTGDLARLDKELLEVIGRSKDLIIHKGFNIYPQEIENVLLSHPAIFKAAVVGREDATSGQVPVAFVAAKLDDEGVESRLKAFCSDHLAGYKIPRKFIIMDDLPLGATGKIDKKKLLSENQ